MKKKIRKIFRMQFTFETKERKWELSNTFENHGLLLYVALKMEKCYYYHRGVS